jgi:chaperonin GroEL
MGFLDTELKKNKSASKIAISSSAQLEKLVIDTVDEIAKMVGSTLGPHGKTILIERREAGLPPYQTKDGVTVARSLGFRNSIQQVILESFRDAAIKTVEHAGDGTTTATVLARGILKEMNKFLKNNKEYSPQQAVREVTAFFEKECVPYIQNAAIKVNKDNYNDLLMTVARVSTNGDEVLSHNVLKAFNLVGDSGHITLAEEGGSPGFEVSKMSGYVINKGYEESCGRFSNEFINDQGNSRVFLENPSFILIDGNLLDMAGLGRLFQLLEQEYLQNKKISTNYVIFAHQFNQQVLAQLAKVQTSSTFKIVPCLTPMDALANSRYDFLRDMAAFTGGKIFNSLNYPLANGMPSDLGQAGTAFEMTRFRSVVHGAGNEATIIQRVHQLKTRRDAAATSKFEKSIIDERIGRLTGGIAKLTIIDVSDSQIRETKDRAEDAICAIRGAARHGVVPGGGRILLNLSMKAITHQSQVVRSVLSPALQQPVLLLLENAGLSQTEQQNVLSQLIMDESVVYNALTKEVGDAFKLKLLDSVPAVLEAIRSAISIAGLLGTLGGVCVFARDDEYDRQKALKVDKLQDEMENYKEPDNSFMLEDE